QWRFYIRGTWGIAPPDPHGTVLQKAQSVLCGKIYVILFNMYSSVNVFVNVCVRKGLTHKHYSPVLELFDSCVFLSVCLFCEMLLSAVLLCSVGYGASLRPLPWKHQ